MASSQKPAYAISTLDQTGSSELMILLGIHTAPQVRVSRIILIPTKQNQGKIKEKCPCKMLECIKTATSGILEWENF